MTKRSWVAGLILPSLLAVTVTAGAQDVVPAVVALDASTAAGKTTVRIEMTSSSISYISYSRDDLTFVIDVYGISVGDIPRHLAVASAEVVSVAVDGQVSGAADAPAARFTLQRAQPGPTPSVRLHGTALVVEVKTGGASSAPRPAMAARRSSTLRTAMGPASGIQDILTEATAEGLHVTVLGDGRLEYQAFELENPPRLVLDFPAVRNRVGRSQIRVGHPAVDRVRVAQYQNEPMSIARVVFDLGADTEYQVVARDNALHVAFGDDPQRMASQYLPTAAVVSDVAEAAQGAPPSMGMVESSIGGMEAADDGMAMDEFGDDEGTLISLDLKDADMKDVLRYFSEISGLNIILDPKVGGQITVRLIDVPWNKALDIILKAHGFGKTLDGNVLRIADLATLTEEETQAAFFEKSRIEAGPLITFTRQISYASIDSVRGLVERTALSSRGSVDVDTRTNTMVITEVDLEEYRDRIDNLIDTIDVPTPQVEIEARIVETSTQFSRSFGLQWGFNQAFDTVTGSTTDLSFPNSGVINGDLIEGDQGFESLLPNAGWAINLPGSGANAAIGFHLANITDTFQLDVVLSAAEDDGKVRVLSSPRVTTQSNIQARINSGLQIPVTTVANNTITTEFVNADLSLTVTPTVTADKTIIMLVDVNQSTPDLGVTIGAGGTPPINTRSANTTLLVPDGGTTVIGGVFQLNEGTSQSRIPVLHKLPILGWLFKNKTDRRSNNELLIFITPKIKRMN